MFLSPVAITLVAFIGIVATIATSYAAGVRFNLIAGRAPR